jgi:hypothetical protein
MNGLLILMTLFIYPMWDSENQRLGMKACTPLGYTVRCIADLIGFSGLILLFGILGVLTLQYLCGQFESRGFWLLLFPLVVGFVGRVLFEFGWRLAAKKKYEYDSRTRTVKWIENGHEIVFPNAR